MNIHNCVCEVEGNEQACKVHKKSRYRSLWEEEEFPHYSEDETNE